MKFRMRTLFFLIMLLPLTGFAEQKLIYRDSNVVAFAEEGILDRVNVHASEIVKLSVNGRVFKAVRGTEPFYLTVPELKAILFVTEESENHATAHFVKWETKKVISVPIGAFAFGGFIGSQSLGRTNGEPGTDYVERVNGDKVRLTMRSFHWKETSEIDLSQRKRLHTETLIFDKGTNVVKRYLDDKQIK